MDIVLQFVLANLVWIAGPCAVLFFIAFVRHMRGSGRRTQIMMYCQWGDLAQVRDIVAVTPWLVHAADGNGFTPLHVAAMWGYADLTALLLRKGARADAANRAGMTPLHCAAMAGHGDVVQALLAAGAPVDARDGVGNTPLYLAVWDGHRDVAAQLIKAGADPSAENTRGETPLDRAEAHGHGPAAELLQQSGGRSSGRLLKHTSARSAAGGTTPESAALAAGREETA